MKLDIDKLDFDHCEDEPIHIPEAIQGYGYLFALEKEHGIIKVISENTSNLFKDHLKIIGENFFNLLRDEDDTKFVKETHERAREKRTRLPLRLKFREEFIRPEHASDFYAVVYTSGDLFVIELEPAGRFREAYSARHFIQLYAISVAPKFSSFKSLDQMSQEIVDTIRDITDMERVVLYRFHDDSSGQVIAESKVDDIESYLHLHYPASDIPPQARDLYKKNWIRLMANVDLEPSRLIPSIEESGREPLDMTYSFLRNLSPIHRQYISNQGLKSSMSMSLVTHDKLWGMISCHSREPRYIPQNVRLECENLSQLFSWHLYAKEEELQLKRKSETEKSIEKIVDKITILNPIVNVFRQNQEDVLNIAKADGFMYFSESDHIGIGETPDLEVMKEVFHQAKGLRSKPLVTTSMVDMVSDTDKLNGIRGMLLVSLVENKNYFTAWFRKEKIQHQRWAGTPEEKSPTASKKDRLTPRSSFQVHTKKIHGHSIPWDTHDVEVAYRFNRVFMAHALEKQEKMREDIVNLELQDRYKNEFLATLAHELRNPLSPIATGISLLEMEDDPHVRDQVMNTMKRQVANMSTMIDDLLDVSRITQGKVRMNLEVLTIQEILMDSLDTCKSIIKQNDHHLTINIPDEDIWIKADRTRLAQVFTNILNNAAKYTDDGGNIDLTAEVLDDCVRVSIRDDGTGIDKEDLESIFTMFTQLNGNSKQTREGLGIGLTLVKKLVAMHNAIIYAYSDGPGMGSEFVVEIPVYMEGGQKANHPARDEKAKKEEKEKVKILVVDDNEDLITIMTMLLKAKGYDVRSAMDGKSALKEYGESKPEVAILDLGLPDMSGFDLMKELKEWYDTSETIFFSHSGLGSKEYIQTSSEMGFKEHFVKPLDSKKLIESLRRHISVNGNS